MKFEVKFLPLHRELMQEELEKQSCSICNSTCFGLLIHNIDGNKKNIFKNNLLCVCDKCHNRIHKGMTKKNSYRLTDEAQDKIFYYRAIWLKKRLKFSKKEVIERLKLERLRLSKEKVSVWFISKERCYVCSSKRNLKYLQPKYANLLNTDADKKKYSIPLCKKCIKEMRVRWGHL